ncbi:MAG: hypothetical protein JSV88_29280 [Candidatus Aminicenantes bacterium]|nr:MAG: hypothetical protein JSV88_29280 [Candidatus Aminicenantes bacterium]
MKKYGIFFIIAIFCLSVSLFPAIYEGKKIDEKHFPATIKKKDTKMEYRVDVVFVGKAANIRFAVNQILPVEANNSFFITLYLENEVIEDPGKILLKQVKPPPNLDDSKPEDWEAVKYWIMKLDLSSLK